MEGLNFKNAVSSLYNYAKDFSVEELENQIEHYSNYIGSSNQPYVINFIRFVILDKISKNIPINLNIINELKENINNSNQDYFIEYPRFKDALPNRGDKPIMAQWTEFAILHQIYFNLNKIEITKNMNIVQNYILSFLKEDFLIKGGWAVKVTDFKGVRNFGDSRVWFSFYPEKDFDNHKQAFQIHLVIFSNYIEYGIGIGSEVSTITGYVREKYMESVNSKQFTPDKMKSFIIGVFSDFKKFNQAIIESGPYEPEDEIGKKPEEVEEVLTSKNIILYGPPGTGKTFLTKKIAVELIEKNKYNLNLESEEIDWKKIKDKYENYIEKNQIKFITFHQAYSYEEFIQGYRYKDDKVILSDGVFKKFVDSIHKEKDYQKPYVFIIDEINRGNVSKIFGEIITIIEDDKRFKAVNETEVILPFTKDVEEKLIEQKFILPPNLYLLGTMNTADRSIALMDIALRRRFHFEGIYPDSNIIVNELTNLIENQESEDIFNSDQIEKIQKAFDKLNKRIEVLLDRDHMIGHSYFLKATTNQALYTIWYGKIIPLLNEYFYNDWEKLRIILGEYDETEKKGFVKDLSREYKDIFKDDREIDYPHTLIEYKEYKEDFLDIFCRTFDIE
jgi:5-methylcytosine-specific restriction protein B